MTEARAEVAVIGGSGFYSLLVEPSEVKVATPFGEHSGPLTVGEIAGRRVAFLPRHGSRHELAPHTLNYRANLWALRRLGVSRVLAPAAVGSLRPDLRPGDFVVLDQLVDRTRNRADTFLDGPLVDHVSFADPYCPELAPLWQQASPDTNSGRFHEGGTVVVIQGPRFSTRAESRWFRSQGWDVVNMTQYPEAVLARELGLCYSGLALVTDYDTGAGPDAGGDAVTMEAVMQLLADNVERTRQLIADVVPLIPVGRTCACAELGSSALRDAGAGSHPSIAT